jgi:large subunit ribosomal protein L29
MKAEVIKEMTTEEISDKIAEEQDFLSKLKINHTVSQLENPMQIRVKRKALARLKTELNKRG